MRTVTLLASDNRTTWVAQVPDDYDGPVVDEPAANPPTGTPPGDSSPPAAVGPSEDPPATSSASSTQARIEAVTVPDNNSQSAPLVVDDPIVVIPPQFIGTGSSFPTDVVLGDPLMSSAGGAPIDMAAADLPFPLFDFADDSFFWSFWDSGAPWSSQKFWKPLPLDSDGFF